MVGGSRYNHRMKKSKVTPEVLAEMRRLSSLGFGTGKIALILEMSRSTVQRARRKYGF